MKTLCLIGAGECPDPIFLQEQVLEADAVWCADGGLRHALSAGITPSLLLGDLDSFPAEAVPPELPLLRFPVEKDDTDTVLAIRLAAAAGFTAVRLLCMTGGRIDHTLANLQALFFGKSLGLTLSIREPDFEILPLTGGESLTLPPAPGVTFSLFAHSDRAEGVTVTGAKYPLEKGFLTNQMPLGISNQRTHSPTRISVEVGQCLVFCPKPGGITYD